MRCATCGADNPKAADPCPSCRAGAAVPSPRTAAELEAAFAADAADAPSGPLRLGQDFGTRYTVLKLVGQGGMGFVYEALDRDLGIAVALKVLRPGSGDRRAVAEMHRRFKTELLLARRVTHKHVIRIHDIGEIDGIKFLTMPYIKGRDLATVLKTGPLPVATALRHARQIAAGLVAAHAAGVIHRDLKPANVMIGDDGNAVLMDFGIARSSAPDAPQRTIAGAVVGTAAYMAPEQARGEAIDHRADIYAFGLILHEMLCGPRFMPKGAVDDLLSRLTGAPSSARSSNPRVPEALDVLVTRCVQPSTAGRFQSALELASALAALSRSGRGSVPGAPPPARRWALKAAAAAALLVLVGVASWMLGRTEMTAMAGAPVAAAATAADASVAPASATAAATAANLPAGVVPVAGMVAAPMPAPSPAMRSELNRAAAVALTDPDSARAAYTRLAAMDPPGASLAASGLSDLELMRRHYAAAAEMLERAIEMDARAKHMAAAAPKYLALAEAQIGLKRPAEAIAAVDHAVEASRTENILFPAARLYMSLDRPAQAQAIEQELAASAEPHGPAYAEVIRGERSLASGDARRAIEMLEALVRRNDLWFARYVLGTAYLQATRYAEASAEFDALLARRDEGRAVFFDNVPSIRYLAALDDWMTLARDGVRRKVAMTGR